MDRLKVLLPVAGAVSLVLTGCGGGGGSSGGPVTTSPPIAAGPVDYAAEAVANYGLASIRAPAAHTAGATGAGVKVAVIDTGLDTGHVDFAGAVDPASTSIVTGSAADLDGPGGHGTAVAGVIGARRNGQAVHGVAYDATILAVRADNPGSCPSNCRFRDSDLAAATDYAVANGATVLNYSLGGSSLGAAFGAALANAVAAGRIVVAAAGNYGDANPINPAALAGTAQGDALVLAVGAVDSNNQLASFSNRAGTSRDYFLVAPGVAVRTTAKGGGTTTVNGTSFAAPHVAGAAAVLTQISPFLTTRQVVQLMLDTATDLGDPGTDAVYGRGLVNLESALQPQGELTVPTGGTVAEGGPELAATTLRLGSAFGDALADSPALAEAVFLDSYSRPFAFDLSGAVTVAPPAAALSAWVVPSAAVTVLRPSPGTALALSETTPERTAERPGEAEASRIALTTALPGGGEATLLRGFDLGSSFGLASGGAAAALPGSGLANPYLGLAGSGDGLVIGRDLTHGFTFRLGTGAGESGRANLAELTKTWAGGTRAGVQVGALTEETSALGGIGGGAFALGEGARTRFATMFASLPVGERAELFGSYTRGVTDMPGASGLLRDFAGVETASAALGVAMRDMAHEDDRLVLALSSPLRVVGGTALLDVPVGRMVDGRLMRAAQRVGLEPSGRQLDAELGYGMALGGAARLDAATMVRFEPGHVKDAAPDYGFGLRYRTRF